MVSAIVMALGNCRRTSDSADSWVSCVPRSVLKTVMMSKRLACSAQERSHVVVGLHTWKSPASSSSKEKHVIPTEKAPYLAASGIDLQNAVPAKYRSTEEHDLAQ